MNKPQQPEVQATMSDEMMALIALTDKIGMVVTQFGIGYTIYPINETTVRFSIHPELLFADIYLTDNKETVTMKVSTVYEKYRKITQ